MRAGVRCAIDVGTVRVGIARSDSGGILASPVSTVNRQDVDFLEKFVAEVVALSPVEIYVGLPLSLSGAHTASTVDALSVAHSLSELQDAEVRLIDERLTTVTAHQQMRSSGKNQKQSRLVIDQIAAVAILTAALDSERLTGKSPGKPLSDFPV